MPHPTKNRIVSEMHVARYGCWCSCALVYTPWPPPLSGTYDEGACMSHSSTHSLELAVLYPPYAQAPLAPSCTSAHNLLTPLAPPPIPPLQPALCPTLPTADAVVVWGMLAKNNRTHERMVAAESMSRPALLDPCVARLAITSPSAHIPPSSLRLVRARAWLACSSIVVIVISCGLTGAMISRWVVQCRAVRKGTGRLMGQWSAGAAVCAGSVWCPAP
mmetsp:Transcript_15474/g.40906  ORF Transcript_15474/g.40906 Transcript_15474/m.40906 type:complete len:218 (-) Transcript_15474:3-656(-)